MRYLEAHRQPGDVILVNLGASWGFGYYWTPNAPERVKNPIVAQDYTVRAEHLSGALDEVLEEVRRAG